MAVFRVSIFEGGPLFLEIADAGIGYCIQVVKSQ